MRTTTLPTCRLLLAAFLFYSLFLLSCREREEDIVINPPTADFYFKLDSFNTLQGHFINTSTSIKSFTWDFGDGKTNSTLRSPIHAYRAPGTYTAKLTTVGWNGITVTTTKEVVAIKPVAVNLLTNSDFLNADAWSTTYVFGDDIEVAFKGKLTLSSAGGQAGILIHQPVTLEAGTYKVTANLDVDASQYGTWTEFYVSPTPPVEEEEPTADQVIGLDTFEDCAKVAFSGDITTANINCRSGENPEKGEITIATPGTYYFTIHTGIYDGSYGNNFHLNSVGLFKLK